MCSSISSGLLWGPELQRANLHTTLAWSVARYIIHVMEAIALPTPGSMALFVL